MYVPEYLITIKFVHCTVNKLKLTFVLHAMLQHFACAKGSGGGAGKGLCFS